MITVGIIGFALQGGGWMPAFSFLANEPSYVLASTDLSAVPLFLLMGTFASVAGFSEDVYAAAAAFLGHRRGGLAYATIGGSAAFGSICGSSTATAATFAKVALPQMLRRGYAPGFSAGVIAAGGTLKSLIPPSLVMIIYCVVAKTFIPRHVHRRHRAGADDHRVQPDCGCDRGAALSRARAGQRESALERAPGRCRACGALARIDPLRFSSDSTAACSPSTRRPRPPRSWRSSLPWCGGA